MTASNAEGDLDLASGRARPDTPRADDRELTPAVAVGWLVLAILGLGGFVALTLLVNNHFVFPFDQPLLDAGGGLGQYMAAWRGLSDSANLPLIAVGVAIVACLLWTRQRPRRSW